MVRFEHRRRPGFRTPILAGLLVLVWVLPAESQNVSTSSWSFLVESVVVEAPGFHVVRLTPSPPGLRYPRTCESLVIHVVFEEPFAQNPFIRENFTPEMHARSIRMFNDAQASGSIVRLGALYEGLGLRSEDDTCEVDSHGLSPLKEEDGGLAVYSRY